MAKVAKERVAKERVAKERYVWTVHVSSFLATDIPFSYLLDTHMLI